MNVQQRCTRDNCCSSNTHTHTNTHGEREREREREREQQIRDYKTDHQRIRLIMVSG